MGLPTTGIEHGAKGGPGAGALPPEVCILLRDILGRNITSKKIPPYPLASPGRRIVAVFEPDDGSQLSICVCDLAFAAYSGAALAMIPAGVAKESVTAGKCEESLLENFTEILSICRQWFQGSSTHMAPPRVYLTKQEIPPNVAAVLAAPKSRADAEITIPGYGAGQLSIVS
jgi:hypothetical protein